MARSSTTYKKGHSATKFKDPKNWKSRFCDMCNTAYERRLTSVGRKYCSNKCRLKAFSKIGRSKKNIIESRKRQKNRWKNGYYSEESINRMKTANLGKMGLHSEKGLKRLSKMKKGKNNPMYGKVGPLSGNWKGGKSFEEYPGEFNEKLKERIRKRGKYCCQLCGRTQEDELAEFNKKIPIHHIDYNKFNNKKNNLVALCIRCNSSVNYDRLDWMKLIQDIMYESKK